MNMRKYFLIKAKMSYWKDKNEATLFEYKIKYAEATFERGTWISSISIKNNKETDKNHAEII